MNEYKQVLTTLDQAKKSILGFVKTLPNTKAIEAVLDGISEYVEDLKAANVANGKAVEDWR